MNTIHNCEVEVFLKDAKGSVYSQKVGSTLAVKQLADKPKERVPKNSTSQYNIERRESKRSIQDKDTMEAEVATPTIQRVNKSKSKVLEAGSSANEYG